MDKKLYAKALHYIARRPRSQYELQEYLKRKKATIEQVNIIITSLKEQRILDDMDFVQWWIEQRAQFRPKSWKAIVHELQQKGISIDIIQKFNSTETTNQDFNHANELVARNMRKYHGLSRQQLYQRLGGYLARRGFSIDVIKACIDDILRK